MTTVNDIDISLLGLMTTVISRLSPQLESEQQVRT